MAKYIFILRKKEIEIELSSSDPGFISKQMKAWQEVFMPGITGLASCKPVKKEIRPIIVQAPPPPPPIDIEEHQQIVIEESADLIKEVESNLQEITEPSFIEPEMVEMPVSEEPTIIDTSEVHLFEEPSEPTFIESVPAVEHEEPEVNLSDFEMDDTLETMAAETAEEDDMDGLFENLQTEMSSQTEIDEVEVPVDTSQEVIHDMSDLLDQFASEEPIDNKTEGFESMDIPEEVNIPEEFEMPEDVEIPEDVQPTIIEVGQTMAEEDDFDSVLSAMADEIETEEEVQIEPEVVIEESASDEDDLFEKLEAAAAIEVETKPAKPEIPKPVAEPQVSIENYINSLTLKTPIDLLLATAFYMENFESLEKFTTKDISARTFKVFKRPVSPNIVLAAVNKGYIEVVPDFTGTAESNEYSLTESGRDFVVKNLS